MRWRRLGAVGAAAACIAIAGCGGDRGPATTSSDSAIATSASTRTEAAGAQTATESIRTLLLVRVAGGVITGGGRQSAALGSTVSIRVTSDVADEVHLHGYDRKVDVTPDAPATLTFTADIPGVFEVELESRALKLLDLVVQ
jgi:hypothetical protein